MSGAYPKDANYGTPGYQHIMFIPTTNIDGKNICFDPVQSTNEKIVTAKEMLASFGYNWVYDSKEDYEKRNVINKEVKVNKQNRNRKNDMKSLGLIFDNVSPPHDSVN